MFFGFIVPILSIIYSLIYGLSHKQRMRKRIIPVKTTKEGKDVSYVSNIDDDDDGISSMWGGATAQNVSNPNHHLLS